MVTPLPVPDEIAHLDIWVLAAVTGLVIAVALSGVRLGRPFGVLLLLGLRGLHRGAVSQPLTASPAMNAAIERVRF